MNCPRSFCKIVLILSLLAPLASGQDQAEIIDANLIRMFAGNNGVLAHDFERSVAGEYEGFYYGSTDSLNLIWGSGLWIASNRRGDYQSSQAYYLTGRVGTQFIPGKCGEADPDVNRYRVYRITSDDLSEPGEDWLNWPVEMGAPVDQDGNPLLIGEQTLFSVFHDCDTARRQDVGTDSEPLGLEVRQLIYAYNQPGDLGEVVFVDYEIINRSGRLRDSVVVGVFSDPDLGMPSNDLFGSHKRTSTAYCYSSKTDARFEPHGFPVIGVMAVSSEKSGTNFYEQVSATSYHQTYAFPISSEAAFNELYGRRFDGADFIDPTTSKATRFPFSGDPRYDIGWIDDEPDDIRMLSAMGPFKLRTSDTIRARFAFLATVGEDKGDALTRFYDLALKVKDFGVYGAGGVTVSGPGRQGFISAIRFVPPEQNWINGVAFAGDFNSSGIGPASRLIGSSLPGQALETVRLNFAHHATSKAYYYAYSGSSWKYLGLVDIPLSAFEQSSGRRLSLIFLNPSGYECDSCFISANNPEAVYYLIVTNSSYDGSGVEKEGYIVSDPLSELANQDLLYVLRYKISGQSLIHNIFGSQELVIEYSRADSPEKIDSLQFGQTVITKSISYTVQLISEYLTDSRIRLEFSDPLNFSTSRTSLNVKPDGSNLLYLNFTPEEAGLYETKVRLYNEDFGFYFDSLLLTGIAGAWPLEGDFNLNGILEAGDVVSYLGYFYREFPLPEIEVDLDLDNSGDVTLSDLVHILNRLFLNESDSSPARKLHFK